MIRFSPAPVGPSPKNEEVDPPMANDDTLAKALANVRQKRASLEAEFERVSTELAKLRQAERSLASIVEGAPLEEPADNQPRRRRASAGEDQPRASRGPRGPRANSAKGRLKTLLEEAGSQGLSHAQISDRLHDVTPNTLATYLSMMTTSGELERHGDFYRAGKPAADTVTSGSDDEDAGGSEHDVAEDGRAEAAE